jgi:hypothetical protein
LPTTDELAADLAAVKASTPTIEELIVTTPICCWTSGTTPARDITSAVWITLLTAPIPLRILSVALSFEYWSLAASDTAYWQAELARHDASAFTVFAVRTSQITGPNANGPVTSRQPWTFDAAAWGSADLATGESLTLRPTPIGSPASSWRLPMLATIRYRPL